jgi:hypothetical protein
MEHYWLIKVTENETTGPTKVGFLRKELHMLATDFHIEMADNLIRQDREVYPDGKKVPYFEAQQLFKKIGGK